MARFYSHIESGVLPIVLMGIFFLSFIAYTAWVLWPTRRAHWEQISRIPLEKKSGVSSED